MNSPAPVEVALAKSSVREALGKVAAEAAGGTNSVRTGRNPIIFLGQANEAIT